jgi:hypothetical protein
MIITYWTGPLNIYIMNILACPQPTNMAKVSLIGKTIIETATNQWYKNWMKKPNGKLLIKKINFFIKSITIFVVEISTILNSNH